jgi:apolipoprotein N-acyltransferase
MLPSLGLDPQTIYEVRRFNEMVGGRFENWTRWIDAIEALRLELGVPMLVGSEAWVNARIEVDQATREAALEREREYNSAYLMQAGPPYQRYDKAVLTPFGETMPYISNWKWLERQLLALGARGMRFNLDAADRIEVLHLKVGREGRTVTLGTPICFEDTVSWLCRRMSYDQGGRRADVLVNMSNDGWLGRFDADRKLHAQIARFRCIENRRPMVRCVNTGVSVHITSLGRVAAAAGDGAYGSPREPGWMLADVMVDSRNTLFGLIGDAFAVCCALLSAWVLSLTFVNRRSAAS